MINSSNSNIVCTKYEPTPTEKTMINRIVIVVSSTKAPSGNLLKFSALIDPKLMFFYEKRGFMKRFTNFGWKSFMLLFFLIQFLFLFGLPGKKIFAAESGLPEVVSESVKAAEILRENGFVVLNQNFKQIFSAYVGQPYPKFITVDSVWYTFRFLERIGFAFLKRQMDERQEKFLQRLRLALKERIEPESSFPDRILLAVDTALVLQSEKFIGLLSDSEKTEAIKFAEEWRRKEKRTFALSPPEVLSEGKGDERSFIGQSEGGRLARKWLETISFRPDDEKESMEMASLALIIGNDPILREDFQILSRPAFLWLGTDVNLRFEELVLDTISGCETGTTGLDSKINNNKMKIVQEMIRKRLTEYKKTNPSGSVFRVPLFLPDVDSESVFVKMFEEVDLKKRPRMSKGEDGGVFPLVEMRRELISDLAMKPVGNLDFTFLSKTWEERIRYFRLAALISEAEPGCKIAKQNFFAERPYKKTTGVVEPCPDFFEHLGMLSRKTADGFRSLLASSTVNFRSLSQRMIEGGMIHQKIALMKAEELGKISGDDGIKAREFQFILQKSAPESFLEPEFECRELMERLKKISLQAFTGKEIDENDRDLLTSPYFRPEDVPRLLESFSEFCCSLAKIAKKQWAGEEIDLEEQKLLMNFGERLAFFNGYEGNSFCIPQDDFPWQISANIGDKGEIFRLGMGRPEAMFVWVNVDGKPVLHLGAVLRPEFAPSSERPGMKDLKEFAQLPIFRFIPEEEKFRYKIPISEFIRIIGKGIVPYGLECIEGSEITKALVEKLKSSDTQQIPHILEAICARAQVSDLESLLDLFESIPEDFIYPLVYKISSLGHLGNHAKKLRKILNSSPKRADAAAFILSQYPSSLDLEEMEAELAELPIRTKRLYCFLFGCVKDSETTAVALLSKLLSDPAPGVRFQAALALGEIGKFPEPVADELIRMIGDENEFVAAAAVHALAAAGEKKAVMPVLARLAAIQKNPQPPDLEKQTQNIKPIVEGISYPGGIRNMMVLHFNPLFPGGSEKPLGLRKSLEYAVLRIQRRTDAK